MRTPLPSVTPFVIVLSVVVLLLGAIHSANAGQVITDEIRQWAHQAVSKEATLALKPADNTVAVLYFQNQTGQPELDFLQMGMAVMLISDLSKLEQIQVVERARMQALVQELKMGTSGLVAKKSAPRVGRLLGARYLVGGDLNSPRQKTITIDSDLLSVPQASVIGSPSTTGPLKTVLSLEKQILFDIIRLLRLELTEAEKKELRKPFTTDIKALMYLVQGIQHSDQGAYGKASEAYRKALEIDPNLEPAKSAIKELGDLGLIVPPPSGESLLRNLRDRVSVNRSPIPDQITKRRYSEPASVLGPGGTGIADVRVQW